MTETNPHVIARQPKQQIRLKQAAVGSKIEWLAPMSNPTSKILLKHYKL